MWHITRIIAKIQRTTSNEKSLRYKIHYKMHSQWVCSSCEYILYGSRVISTWENEQCINVFPYLWQSHHRKHNVTYMRRHVFITRPITCGVLQTSVLFTWYQKHVFSELVFWAIKFQCSLVKCIGILACTNPRMLVPFKHESRFSVAKSLAIYFNTLERKFSRAFLCVGNTSGWRPNAASADV